MLATLLVALLAPALAPAGASPSSPRRVQAELDSFFKTLGLRDYSAQSKESLERGFALNDIGAEALKINVRRYAMVNHAREIAAIILSEAYPRLPDPQFRTRFLPYVVKFLALKPLGPPLQLPRAVKDAGPSAVNAFLEQSARINARRQTADLLSEYREVLAVRANASRPQDKRVSEQLAKYVMRMYLDPQIGRTQWLGRALVLGLARYARLHDGRELEELSAEASKLNIFVDNYIGSTLVLQGKDGLSRLKVETGDLIFKRSRDIKESAAIAAVALPEDERGAARMGLVGSLLDAIWDVSEDSRANGLTWIQRRKIRKAQEERSSQGMSHVAQLAVYRDPATGIEHTLIWDDYPYSVHLAVDKDEEWGGVRLNGLEHFANPADVLRVGIVTLDKDKLYDVAQAALLAKRDRWTKKAWVSYVPKITKDREIVPLERPARRDWEFQLTREEFIALHGTLDRRRWLEDYQKRLVGGWETMLTKWGVWFNWIDAGAGSDEHGKYQPGRYWFGGMYCSQAVNLASLLFTGVDLEVRPSHYGRSLVWAQRLGIQKARQLDPKAPVIAPSSLALQPYSNPMIQVVYPPYSLSALARYAFVSAREATAEADGPGAELAFEELAPAPLEKGEKEALVLRQRKFLEYVNIDQGRTREQIFGTEPRAHGKVMTANVAPQH